MQLATNCQAAPAAAPVKIVSPFDLARSLGQLTLQVHMKHVVVVVVVVFGDGGGGGAAASRPAMPL